MGCGESRHKRRKSKYNHVNGKLLLFRHAEENATRSKVEPFQSKVQVVQPVITVNYHSYFPPPTATPPSKLAKIKKLSPFEQTFEELESIRPNYRMSKISEFSPLPPLRFTILYE